MLRRNHNPDCAGALTIVRWEPASGATPRGTVMLVQRAAADSDELRWVGVLIRWVALSACALSWIEIIHLVRHLL